MRNLRFSTAFLLGVAVVALPLFALLWGASADHMACARPALPMPRSWSVHPGTPNIPAWRAAFAEVQAQSNGRVSFVERAYGRETDVYVLPSAQYSDGRTWVAMPCGRIESEVYAGTDVDLSYWAAHEVMHTFSAGDHIHDGSDPTGYINPRYCPSWPYVGVMSYCTPRSQWWGANDDAFFLWWF